MYVDPDGTWSWKRFWKTMAVIAVATVAVVAVAAVTVASGGTIMPVLINASVGAFTSAATSTLMQLTTTGHIDFAQLAVDAFIGAVAGSLGGSSLGHIGMGFSNALNSFVGSLAGDWVNDEAPNFKKAGVSALVSGAFGFMSKGAQNDLKLSKALKNTRIKIREYKSVGRTKGLLNLENSKNNFKKLITQLALKRSIPTVSQNIINTTKWLWFDVPMCFM